MSVEIKGSGIVHIQPIYVPQTQALIDAFEPGVMEAEIEYDELSYSFDGDVHGSYADAVFEFLDQLEGFATKAWIHWDEEGEPTFRGPNQAPLRAKFHGEQIEHHSKQLMVALQEISRAQ